MKISARVVGMVSLWLLFSATTEASSCRRPRRLVTINPPTLFDPTPFGYSHIAVDTKNNIATIAGQVAFDRNATVIGTTLAEQLIEVERSLIFALEAVDAGVEDIFKLNAYIKDFNPSTDIAQYTPTGMRLGSPPSTLISVPSLALEDLLVEIEISAVVSERFVRNLAARGSTGSKRSRGKKTAVKFMSG